MGNIFAGEKGNKPSVDYDDDMLSRLILKNRDAVSNGIYQTRDQMYDQINGIPYRKTQMERREDAQRMISEPLQYLEFVHVPITGGGCALHGGGCEGDCQCVLDKNQVVVKESDLKGFNPDKLSITTPYDMRGGQDSPDSEDEEDLDLGDIDSDDSPDVDNYDNTINTQEIEYLQERIFRSETDTEGYDDDEMTKQVQKAMDKLKREQARTQAQLDSEDRKIMNTKQRKNNKYH